jgi:hypothetical protein
MMTDHRFALRSLVMEKAGPRLDQTVRVVADQYPKNYLYDCGYDGEQYINNNFTF